uniref:WGS project CAEQ00000000 data, annotated contig 983 n=1 Tax=Trypanosoma congolense (strain IL3000) TaxID=1068625 RepID=F9WK35_TRYCI|nr:unnamed protein product [Trypanosoma congolense IL3000]
MEPYRPRTYSCKASIPRLTCDSRGGERKRGRHRKCSPKGVDNEALKQNDNEKSDTLTVDKGPSLAAFSLLLACASVFTVVLIVPAPLQLLLHVSSIHFCVLLLCFFLGVAVHDPVKGSNMKRNNIRNTFVDWLCVECLSLNFTMRSKCFVCRAPYDAKRCLAVFSSRQQNDQSVYDPDHSAYMQEVELNFSSSPTQLKRVKYNKRH